jgi:hypothetical protein
VAITESKNFAPTLQNFTPDYDQTVRVERKETEVPEDDIAYRMELDLVVADPRQLLLYFSARFNKIHGYEYVVDWIKEYSTFKAFKQRYGPDAGPMLQVLFDRYGGMWNGQPVSTSMFSRGAKWIQDILYNDLHEMRRSLKKSTESSKELLHSDDLLSRFK